MRLLRPVLFGVWITLSFGFAEDAPATQATSPPPIFTSKGDVPYVGMPEPADSIGSGTLPERLALVVGIDHYDHHDILPVDDLTNAEQDAEDVGDALHDAGFYVDRLTTTRLDHHVTRNDILNRLADLAALAANAPVRSGRRPVVLVYFAGHGFNSGGFDYLAPADFAPRYLEDIPEMALSLNEVADRLTWAGAALRIVVADACRTPLPITLPSHGAKDASVTVAAGMIPPANISATPPYDDRLLAYAARRGDPASSNSANKVNGAFAAAFISEMKKARLDSEKAGSLGVKSSISTILEAVHGDMLNDVTVYQDSEYLNSTGGFILFPTKAEYALELGLWHDAGARANEFQASHHDSNYLLAIRTAIVCNYRDFLSGTSVHSFFGKAGQDAVNAFPTTGITCPDDLKTNASISASSKLVKPITGVFTDTAPSQSHGSLTVARRIRLAANGAPAGFAEGAALDDLRISDILSSARLSNDARADLRRFAPDTRIDDLAVASATLPLFETSKLEGKPIEVVSPGSVVQLLGLGAGGAVRVRSSTERVGFASQQAVDGGRVALAFTVAVDGKGNLAYNADTVDYVLDRSIVTDAAIAYPQNEGLLGYAAAQKVLDRFQSRWQSNRPDVKRFLASIVTAKKNWFDAFDRAEAPTQVKVSVSVLPLTMGLRSIVASASGTEIPLAAAKDLDPVPVAELQSGHTIRDFAPPQTLVVVDAERCLGECPKSRCAGALASASEIAERKPITAYVQFSSPSQQVPTETIRQILKGGGISVPAAELVAAAPHRNEVRVCRDQNRKSADATAEVLSACAGGQYIVGVIAPCRRTSAYDTVEVWLAAP